MGISNPAVRRVYTVAIIDRDVAFAVDFAAKLVALSEPAHVWGSSVLPVQVKEETNLAILSGLDDPFL
jgi:hypothetical protein